MGSTRGSMVLTITFMVLIGCGAVSSLAQVARFDSYQFQALPNNANILIGPFYSDLAFFQSVGARYVTSSGEGMDYLRGNRDSGAATAQDLPRYGQIQKDGIDFPLISQLTARNYLLISKYMSLDVSFSLTYRCYPNGSEDNDFDVEILDPGFYAHMGSFTFSASKDSWMGGYNGRNVEGFTGNRQSGFSANISTDFELTPFVRGRVYDRPSYRVDYVDQRGYSDNLSGQRYPVFQNLLGLDLDWLMAPDKTMGYTASRTDTIPQDNGYDVNRSIIYHQMLEYRQQINPLTAAGVRGDWIWRDFLGARGGQDQRDVVAFMNSDVTEDSSINASVGYSAVTLREGSGYETNGTSGAMIGELGLQTRLSETISHGVSYARYQRSGFIAGVEVVDALRYTIKWVDPDSWAVGFASAYESVSPRLSLSQDYSDWMNQLTASRPLTHDLMLTMASAYIMRFNTVPQTGDLGEGDLFMSNDYDTWATTVGLIQALTQRLKLYYYVEHLERISSNPLLQGKRDIVGMSLGYYYDF